MTAPQRREQRPTSEALHPKNQPGGLRSTVRHQAFTVADAAIPAPNELSARGWAIASAYYQNGLLDGIEIGRQQIEDEWRGRQAVSAAIARQIASWGPYDQLAERRGDHERADVQRALLRERGVIA